MIDRSQIQIVSKVNSLSTIKDIDLGEKVSVRFLRGGFPTELANYAICLLDHQQFPPSIHRRQRKLPDMPW